MGEFHAIIETYICNQHGLEFSTEQELDTHIAKDHKASDKRLYC